MGISRQSCGVDQSSDEELELQYSPSQWSRRLAADIIVDEHIKVLGRLSGRFQPAVVIPYGDSGEEHHFTAFKTNIFTYSHSYLC